MADRSMNFLLKRSQMSVRASFTLRDNMTRCVEKSLRAIARSRELIANSEVLLGHSRPVDVDGLVLHRPAQVGVDSLPVISARDFNFELVSTDGKHFRECAFRSCTLHYSGSPVTFESCQFCDCKFEFSGAAGRTVQFLECFGLQADRPKAPPDSDSGDSRLEFLN